MPFHQTVPTSYFDREVQSKPRVPDIVLALPFPLVRLGSVCKKKQRVPGSNVFIGWERVAAALLIASTAACSSKASPADTRMIKRLASPSPSSTTVGHCWMGNDRTIFHQFAIDLHSLAKKLVLLGKMPNLPALWFGAWATSQLTVDMALHPATWCCKIVLPTTSLMVAILFSTRPFCHGEHAPVVCT